MSHSGIEYTDGEGMLPPEEPKSYEQQQAERVAGIAPEHATRSQVEESVLAWREVRAARLEQDKKAEKMKEYETVLANWLISAMRGQAFEGLIVGGRITSVTEKQQATVEDRHALSEHILDTRQLDLLHFRLSGSAVQNRIDAGETVPGVGFIPVFGLSDRKAK